MSPIQSIQPIRPLEHPDAVGKTPSSSSGDTFSQMFVDAIQNVENYRAQSEQATDRFLNGETAEIHQIALASQRAEVAFETLIQVRNKVVQAYQEIMRMQI